MKALTETSDYTCKAKNVINFLYNTKTGHYCRSRLLDMTSKSIKKMARAPQFCSDPELLWQHLHCSIMKGTISVKLKHYITCLTPNLIGKL